MKIENIENGGAYAIEYGMAYQEQHEQKSVWHRREHQQVSKDM